MDLLRCFLINCLWLLMAWAESHSLKYLISAISKPAGFSAYSLNLYIDDVELASYNDETRIFQSRLKGPVESDYWVDRTLVEQQIHLVLKNNMIYANSVLNQTRKENVYQLKFACMVDGDGKNHDGYLEYAENGKEFITFDKERILYIPVTFRAEIITQFFNKNTFTGHRNKYRMESECPELLRKYLKYASYELAKKVHPEVKVWARLQSDELTRLYCLVYGFYPRAVDVKWMRNGEDDVPSYEMTPILPHPDGTYQIRVSVEVPTKEADTYSCHVDHSSLKEVLTKKYEPDNGTQYTMIIAIACAVAIIAVILGVGIFCYKKRGKGYKTTSTSDASSDSSSNPKA